MIKGMIRLFIKGVVKSSVTSAVTVGIFLVGREVGKIEMGKTIIKPTQYGTLTVDKNGFTKDPEYGHNFDDVRSIDGQ